MRKLLIVIVVATLYAACKTASMNVAVPDRFAANATQMKVSGLNGSKKRPQLTLGNYQNKNINETVNGL